MTDYPQWTDLPEPAQRLAGLMADLSQKHWCAGWLDGCEYALWAIVDGASPHWGAWGEPDGVTPEEIAQLKALSDECGGWIAWRNGEVFVPMAEWLAEYEAHGKGKVAHD